MIQTISDGKQVRSSIPLKQDVLILGGGVSGITIAMVLARAGVHVTIIEKGINLGGSLRQLHIFHDSTEGADRWLAGIISRIGETENIAIISQAELCDLQGHFGSFRAKIMKADGETFLLSPAIIVAATGYITRREAPGMPAAETGIIYLPDMERLIAEATGDGLSCNGRPVASVIFLLDAVNEDMKIDSINILKQAIILCRRFNCQVSVLCRELKVSFAGGERLYRKAREEGALFFKYDILPEFFTEDGRICVALPDDASRNKEAPERINIKSDVIVLPETCLPGAETDKLCRILRTPLGKGGYFMDDNPQFLRVRSNRRGIFLVGACRFPQELTETQREAEAAAQEIIALLLPGVYRYGPLVAEVDARKCALCYTCPRLCPHSAIDIEKYAKRNVYQTFDNGAENMGYAARVEPSACYGCGICVAECPARAIILRGEASHFHLGQ